MGQFSQFVSPLRAILRGYVWATRWGYSPKAFTHPFIHHNISSQILEGARSHLRRELSSLQKENFIFFLFPCFLWWSRLFCFTAHFSYGNPARFSSTLWRELYYRSGGSYILRTMSWEGVLKYRFFNQYSGRFFKTKSFQPPPSVTIPRAK